MSGKTPKVVEKMVQGRLRKYFEETVLLDQKFVINDAMNVQVSSNGFFVWSFQLWLLILSLQWFEKSVHSPACCR